MGVLGQKFESAARIRVFIVDVMVELPGGVATPVK
jgi:hypothetical protein